MKGFFVTGTDTEVGKTYASRSLIEFLCSQGHRVSALKPIASGCETVQGELRNQDALILSAAANVKLNYTTVNRYAFEPAIAPHLAAHQAGVDINLSLIAEDLQTASSLSDFTVVEGAGGWMVPLNKEQYIADLAKALNLPVILVVGIRLGCINHALLTADLIQQSGLELYGWVANECQGDAELIEDQITAIEQRLVCPRLCHIKHEAHHISQARWNLGNCS